MINSVTPTLQSEANLSTISALQHLLRPDFLKAENRNDLKQRLASKGFALREGFLATMPQGKLVCSVDRLY